MWKKTTLKTHVRIRETTYVICDLILQDICLSNYFAKVHCSNLLCLNVTWYPHKSPIDQLKGYFKGCTLHCIQIFWYFLDGKNVFRSIHYGHAAYNMPPRNIYAAAHNMLPRELNIPIIKSNTWPREPLLNQLTRKLGALELISLFLMWEQGKQINKKMKRDNSTKSQHQVLDDKCHGGISSFY